MTQTKKKNNYFCTLYHFEKDRYEPVIPLTCSDNNHCKITINHYRKRKTGPQFPLAVVTCLTHNISFTLYPPGYVPYGRVQLYSVTHEGKLIDCSESAKENDLPEFEDTYFKAALDASKGIAWPRSSPEWGDGGAGRYWSTQCRHLTVSSHLMGLSEKTSSKQCEVIAEVLGVDRILLNGLKHQTGYRNRGEAIYKVLKASPLEFCILDKLLTCGYSAGLWGEPHQLYSPRM